MPISGRFLQFNIASALSFQFRANFAQVNQNRAQQSQIETFQKDRIGQSEDRRTGDQSEFYKVVGPYADSAPSTRNATPKRAALPTADRQISIPRNKKTAEKVNIGKEFIHSYNQNGQQVYAMTGNPTIDFFI